MDLSVTLIVCLIVSSKCSTLILLKFKLQVLANQYFISYEIYYPINKMIHYSWNSKLKLSCRDPTCCYIIRNETKVYEKRKHAWWYKMKLLYPPLNYITSSFFPPPLLPSALDLITNWTKKKKKKSETWDANPPNYITKRKKKKKERGVTVHPIQSCSRQTDNEIK